MTTLNQELYEALIAAGAPDDAAKRAAAVEKRRARDKRYRLAHPESLRERSKRAYDANAGKACARARAWRAANPERANARNKAYRDAHLEEARARARARYAANREKILAQNKARMAAPGKWRARNLKQFYGITPEQYQAMLHKQGGGCAICGTASPGAKGSFAVDHYHATNKIRGVLCSNCNTALGLLKDSIETAQAVVAYLVQHDY